MMHEHLEIIDDTTGSCVGRCMHGHRACIVHSHVHKGPVPEVAERRRVTVMFVGDDGNPVRIESRLDDDQVLRLVSLVSGGEPV